MPDDYKMELLSTNHPNEKVIDFVKWIAGRASASLGLSEAYATLTPGSDFRAQQLMSAPVFIEAQKHLEGICDWVLHRYLVYLSNRNEFDFSRLPANWMRSVTWTWPTLDEVDEVAHQNAVTMKLRNMTTTLKDELGSDWQEKLQQTKLEMEWCAKNGIPHPAL